VVPPTWRWNKKESVFGGSNAQGERFESFEIMEEKIIS
jgi:hypothetical protein